MDQKLYDVVIVGSGPAGLTAAIYAARAELSTLVIEKEPMSGGQIINTYEVDNYPGLPGLSGFDMSVKFREHCDKLGVEHKNGEVSKMSLTGKVKEIVLTSGEMIQSKTVILAMGAKYRKLGAPGEEKFSGMGVSYCATCDGAFFRNRETAVIGGGDVAVEDAIFLARGCKKVYVIHRRDEFRAAKTLSSSLMKLDNVEIVWNHVVTEIQGEDMVTGIVIEDVNTKEQKTISLNGVFIAVGTIPNTEIVPEELELDKGGYIIADESCKTNIPGVFAAGDVRTKQLRQIITAASDGANAITSVEHYLVQG